MVLFDMDGTLTLSRVPVDEEMARLLTELTETVIVGVVSGCAIERFRSQLIEGMPRIIKPMYLFPCCGTAGYVVDESGEKELYAEDMPHTLWKVIMQRLQEARELFAYPLDDVIWGKAIDDRKSEICLAGLGVDAPLEDKELWDVNQVKRRQVAEWLRERLPDCEVIIGGTTTISVLQEGKNKAYCLEQINRWLGIHTGDIFFVGDALDEGGNDYPISLAGVDTMAVASLDDTKKLIRDMLS